MVSSLPPSATFAVEQIERWAFPRGLIFEGSLTGGAVFSADRRYRYLLWRGSGSMPFAAFAMLNPSMAGARQDDPSVRRCLGFAGQLQQPLLIWNLFALIATNPAELGQAVDPAGPHNDDAIDLVAPLASPTIAAWGTGGSLLNRDRQVLRRIAAQGFALHALQLTRAGFPGHPLYLPGALQPQP